MKPGYKTTEFLMLVVGLIAVIVAGLTITDGSVNFLIDAELLKWWLLGTGGYSISRGMAKGRNGNGTTPPAPPTG